MTEDEFKKHCRKEQPLDYSRHELLDRLGVVLMHFNSHISSHQTTESNSEYLSLAQKAETAIHDFYQKVGCDHL